MGMCHPETYTVAIGAVLNSSSAILHPSCEKAQRKILAVSRLARQKICRLNRHVHVYISRKIEVHAYRDFAGTPQALGKPIRSC
jgi:hypothetical protein